MIPKIEEIPRRVTSWLHPKVELRKSPIEGYGLFATGDIRKGRYVSVFGGKVYTSKEIAKLPEDSYIANGATQLDNDFWLGPVSENAYEWGFHINHSCSPNTKIWRSVFLVAIKTIKKDEEVTFDYAHSHNKCLNFKCRCGSKDCRKFISNKDYLDNTFYTKNKIHIVRWMKDLAKKI